MAIPPGPQIPFDPNRKYGQEPGFVSRHSGKLFIALIIAILLIALSIVLVLNSESDDENDHASLIDPAELYSPGVTVEV